MINFLDYAYIQEHMFNPMNMYVAQKMFHTDELTIGYFAEKGFTFREIEPLQFDPCGHLESDM